MTDGPLRVTAPNGTEADAHALGSGSLVRSLPGSDVAVTPADGGTAVGVASGSVWVTVPPGGSPVAVAVGAFTARVFEGRAAFDAGERGDGLVLVADGSVEVTDDSGAIRVLNAGEAAVLSPDGSLAVDTVGDDELADDPWVEANLELDIAEFAPVAGVVVDGSPPLLVGSTRPGEEGGPRDESGVPEPGDDEEQAATGDEPGDSDEESAPDTSGADTAGLVAGVLAALQEGPGTTSPPMHGLPGPDDEPTEGSTTETPETPEDGEPDGPWVPPWYEEPTEPVPAGEEAVGAEGDGPGILPYAAEEDEEQSGRRVTRAIELAALAVLIGFIVLLLLVYNRNERQAAQVVPPVTVTSTTVAPTSTTEAATTTTEQATTTTAPETTTTEPATTTTEGTTTVPTTVAPTRLSASPTDCSQQGNVVEVRGVAEGASPPDVYVVTVEVRNATTSFGRAVVEEPAVEGTAAEWYAAIDLTGDAAAAGASCQVTDIRLR